MSFFLRRRGELTILIHPLTPLTSAGPRRARCARTSVPQTTWPRWACLRSARRLCPERRARAAAAADRERAAAVARRARRGAENVALPPAAPRRRAPRTAPRPRVRCLLPARPLATRPHGAPRRRAQWGWVAPRQSSKRETSEPLGRSDSRPRCSIPWEVKEEARPLGRAWRSSGRNQAAVHDHSRCTRRGPPVSRAECTWRSSELMMKRGETVCARVPAPPRGGRARPEVLATTAVFRFPALA